MLSKKKIRLIKSLAKKKYRREYGLFVAEGKKIIEALMESDYEVEELIGLERYAELFADVKYTVVDENEFLRVSFQKNPQGIMALVRIPSDRQLKFNPWEHGLVLMLDDIQDPGNLGTILRVSLWFGVREVICSVGSVDVYNPKVVQASMGAIFFVNVYYDDLENILRSAEKGKVYGAFMDGENVYKARLTDRGIIVLGNEAHGIRENLAGYIGKRIGIPKFFEGKGIDSLNLAMSTGIILSEFRRRQVLRRE